MGMTDEDEDKADDLDEDENKDVRTTQHRKDKMIADNEGYVSDSDDEGGEELSRPVPRKGSPRKFLIRPGPY